MIISKSRICFLLSVVILFYNFFMPTFNSIFGGESGISGTGAVIFNLGLAILLILFVAFTSLSNLPSNVLFYFSLLLALGWFVLICASILFSDIIIWRDTFELHRPILYFLTFLFGCHLASFSEERQLYYFKCFFFSLFVISLFAICQYNGLLDSLSRLYTKSHNVVTQRSTGVFVNPYDLAYIFLLPFLFCILFVVMKKFNSVQLIILPFFFLSILMSQSKTGVIILLASIVLTVMLLCYFLLKNGSLVRLLIFFVAVIILIAFLMISFDFSVLIDKFAYSFLGLMEFLDGKNNSFNIRLNQVSYIIESKKSILDVIIGNGVQKEVMDIIENQYYLFFYRYGVLGLFYIFSVIFVPLYFSIKLVFSKKFSTNIQQWERILYITIMLWILITIVAAYTNPYLDMIRNQFIYYSLCGFVITSYFKYIKIKSREH